jgi:hypothetical protein
VATALSAPLNLSAASMGQHNENAIQAKITAYFQISINQEGRSQRRIPSDLPPNFIRNDLSTLITAQYPLIKHCAVVVNSMTTTAHPVIFTIVLVAVSFLG